MFGSRTRAPLAALLLAPLFAGCGSTSPASGPPSPGGQAASPAISVTTASPTPATTPPAQASDLPSGVYRVRLDNEAFASANPGDVEVDSTPEGVWTLTVTSGHYMLACRPLNHPLRDCGDSETAKEVVVEYGWLKGTGHTVWFVHDIVGLSKLNGCDPVAQTCGPTDGYHLDWQAVSKGLKFSNYVGLGDEAGCECWNWTVVPWTKIS